MATGFQSKGGNSMTIFTLDGAIASIVTQPDFSIQSLAGGASGTPTTISPSGAKRTIVLASEGTLVSDTNFQMSSAFNVGDLVEIYNDSPTANGLVVFDENGNDIGNGELGNPGGANRLTGSVITKLRATAGYNWGWSRLG
jgi:hypothetical protein